MKKAHEYRHHGHTGITRHSPRNGFNSLYRALGFAKSANGADPRQIGTTGKSEISVRTDKSVWSATTTYFLVHGGIRSGRSGFCKSQCGVIISRALEQVVGIMIALDKTLADS
jgi:hypothetical protein